MKANSRLISVAPWTHGDFLPRWDAFIGACGYEHRSKFIAKEFLQQFELKTALAFSEQRTLNFSSNLKWFDENGFETFTLKDEEFEAWALQYWNDLFEKCDRDLRVCIDISSMSRFWVASLIEAVSKSTTLGRPVKIDFLYARAKFSLPTSPDGPIIFACPVTSYFAGWTDQPEAPTTLVFGLGYETDKAVGVTEYLEPAEVWAFVPTGHEIEYKREVDKANNTLWDLLPNDHLIEYPVNQPFQCFSSLESLVFGTTSYSRPVIVPFGPKIFTLCSLLVASLHYPQVSVWRVSSGSFADPVDRIEDGTIVGLTTEFKQQL